ncbi:MAG: cell wall hydrolase [Peptococcaceae bacterium]|jgi:N-acetylmuramoyl-L-alanine amidase|nr:cell wall hydrolase [Peptococcaceae bacterium]
MKRKTRRVLGFVLASALLWTMRTAAAASASGVAASGDAYMLAKLISGEARGESYIGQVAVGAVVVNRLQNPNFPNSLSGVVFEPGAFDAVWDGQYHKEPTVSAVQAAQSALAGWDPTGGALYYWNPISATSDWIWSRSVIARIGRHVFAR